MRTLANRLIFLVICLPVDDEITMHGSWVIGGWAIIADVVSERRQAPLARYFFNQKPIDRLARTALVMP